VQPWVKQFISELHAKGLKPRGFTKKRHTFSRAREEYVERFQVQGSSWNSGGNDPWIFYLNAGVFFPNLPEPTQNRGFVGTHVYGRLREFDPTCLDACELNMDGLDRTLEDVITSVERASSAIAANVERLHERPAARRFLIGNALARTTPR